MNNDLVSPRNGSHQRRRLAAPQIQHYLDEFQRSGLSAAAFVRQHQLCYATFCRWRKQPPTPGAAAPQPQPRLQAVPLDSLFSAGWAAEIVLPECATLRLSAQASPTWISQLVEALRR